MVKIHSAIVLEARQPAPMMKGEWSLSTKPLKFAIGAIDAATAYLSFLTHPAATCLGICMALPSHSTQSLRISTNTLEMEMVERQDLLSKLAWRSLCLGLAYLETRGRISDGLISSALAFFAGVRFSQLAENQFVIPSRIEYRESGEEPNPSVICSIQVGNDVTVYESRP